MKTKQKISLAFLFSLCVISCLAGTAYALEDPVPGDGYTAVQNYLILAMVLVAIFVIWAGCLGRSIFVMLTSGIFCLIIGLLLLFVW